MNRKNFFSFFSRRKGFSADSLSMTIVIYMFMLVVGWPEIALAQTCSLNQITNTIVTFSSNPSIDASGTRVAFHSDGNFTGQNADGNIEIFLFDTTTSTFTQITNTTGWGLNFNSSISASGARISFESDGNFTGQNADGNIEIFLFDTTTSAFTQITNTTGWGLNFNSLISASGTRVAFHSDGNFTGQNADGNIEIFFFDTTTSAFTQVTNTTWLEFSFAASIDASGTRIAFESDGNFTGQNADGNLEIFIFDTTTSAFTQITITTGLGFNSSPAISAYSTRIAFISNEDFTGQNADGNIEIFFFDTTTSAFVQITNTTGGSNFAPSINTNGTRIAFESDNNFTGQNVDGNIEIFFFDTTTSAFVQITNTTGWGLNFNQSISASSASIVFESDNNFTGQNADRNIEIFLSSCTSATSVPTVNEWGMAVFMVFSGLGAIYYLRAKNRSLKHTHIL